MFLEEGNKRLSADTSTYGIIETLSEGNVTILDRVPHSVDSRKLYIFGQLSGSLTDSADFLDVSFRLVGQNQTPQT